MDENKVIALEKPGADERDALTEVLRQGAWRHWPSPPPYAPASARGPRRKAEAGRSTAPSISRRAVR